MSRRAFTLHALGAGLGSLAGGCAPPHSHAAHPPYVPPPESPPPRGAALSARHLPRWRGFNLLEKFIQGQDGPYQEWDLDFIAEHGFDFVRLPLDYRIWTEAPGKYREAPLHDLDDLVRWARARGIHVNVALHRAPGYSVNRHPPEALDLWGTGPGSRQAQQQFVDQWRLLAERFADEPASSVSFNLVNEPVGVSGARYAEVVEPVVSAIREASPERIVVADGLDYGREPVPELVSLGLAQSTRGYAPFQLTHFRASWVAGSDQWSVPTWPVPMLLGTYVYGPKQEQLQGPVVLRGDFAAGLEVSLHVVRVSQRTTLLIRADGEVVLSKQFDPGPGQGEWRSSDFEPRWGIYQATYDQTYSARLPRACRELRIEIPEGDWITFSHLALRSGDATIEIRPTDADWGRRQGEYAVAADGTITALGEHQGIDRQALFDQTVAPWADFAKTHGIGIHVGEWGAHHATPHAVVLHWMQDCLENWRRAELGWALWNLRGSFGCVDSERADVTYEDYLGHQLDRRMLQILKQDGDALASLPIQDRLL